MRINSAYDALIGEVDRFGGSVISFAGDAITCWFDAGLEEPSRRAVMCAQGMQSVMLRFPDLSVKVSVSSGPVRRFVVGDPAILLIDTLAGAPVARLAMAEHLARAGEILLDEPTVAALRLSALESRTSETGERFFVLDPAIMVREPRAIHSSAATSVADTQVDSSLLKSWVLPMVYNIQSTGHGLLLTELRPTVALFVRFIGIDYNNDEGAREKLNTVISQVQRIVGRYEGVVLEFTIGDKGSYLFASFGAAHVHEDDARRAVRAALEIKQKLDGFLFLNSVQFGLSSGTMRVGAYGSLTRRSFGAMGDDVNLAARLMMAAAPGEILMSQRVRKSVAEEFMVEARLPLAMKGKAEPVPVYAVLGFQRHRAIRLQEPSYVLPMIGRRRELALLEQKLGSVLEGQGQVIGITAEAGMGKSRLVAEGIRLASRRRMAAYGGTCRSEGINSPYLVWQDIWSAFLISILQCPCVSRCVPCRENWRTGLPSRRILCPCLGHSLGCRCLIMISPAFYSRKIARPSLKQC